MRKPLFQNRIAELVASLLLGPAQVMAISMYAKDSLAFWGRSVWMVLLFIGLSLLFAAIFFFALWLIQTLCGPRFVAKKQTCCDTAGKKPCFLDRHPFLAAVIILSIFYLPWIIIFYPGSMTYDMMYQVLQGDGFLPINAHHPIFATYVVSALSRLGLALTGRLELGIFLYTLLQCGICVLGFAFIFSFAVRRGIRRGWQIAILVFFAVTPLWGGAMQTGTKDVLFTGVFVIWMTLSAKLLLEKEKRFGAGNWVLYTVCMVVLCLYRNAVWIVLAVSLFAIILASGKRILRPLILCGVIMLAVNFGFGAFTAYQYGAKTETAEILSIPFQQTARTVRDHPEDVTPEEQRVIEETFRIDDWETIGKRYYPMASDPVKAKYVWWASDEQPRILKQYFATWAEMGAKHPDTYLEALIAQTCGYYTILPRIQKETYGAGTTVQFEPDSIAIQSAYEEHGTIDPSMIPETPECMEGARQVLMGWYELWRNIPPLSFFTTCGFYTLILLALVLFYIKRKEKAVVLAIPLILLILMAIASPVNEHIRYILPVAASLPLLIAAAGTAVKPVSTEGAEADSKAPKETAIKKS